MNRNNRQQQEQPLPTTMITTTMDMTVSPSADLSFSEFMSPIRPSQNPYPPQSSPSSSMQDTVGQTLAGLQSPHPTTSGGFAQQHQFFSFPPQDQIRQSLMTQSLPSTNQQRAPPPIFTTRMTSQPQMSPNFGGHMRIPLPPQRIQGPGEPRATFLHQQNPVPSMRAPLPHSSPVRQQLIGGPQPQFVQFHNPTDTSGQRMPLHGLSSGLADPQLNNSPAQTAPTKSKPKKSKKKPPQPKVTPQDPLALVAPPGSAPIPPAPKPKSRKKPSQTSGAPKKLSAAALKLQEEELKYSRKHQLLKRCVKALVFKNAALCDEVARLNQRIHTVTEERKVLLKRIFHHERLKQKKLAAAQRRLAAQAQKAEEAKAPVVTPT